MMGQNNLFYICFTEKKTASIRTQITYFSLCSPPQTKLKMTDQSPVPDYRGAIALNNMGVSLLEQRAYRQGMDTLKDAIFVMKRVYRPKSGLLTPTFSLPSTSNVKAKLERAIKRMANPHPVPSAWSVGVISHDPTSFYQSTIDSVLRGGPVSPFTFPIRIETVDFDSLEDRDPDMESAIMLHNFGIAYLCMSKQRTNSPGKLQEGALKLFNMSYSVISNMNNMSRLSEEQMQQISETRLLLAVVVLNNVVQVLTDMGKDSEANESYQRLVRLGTAIREMDEPDLVESRLPGAGAA
jgi:hypothetical protein